MKHFRSKLLIAMLVMVLAILAACGDNDPAPAENDPPVEQGNQEEAPPETNDEDPADPDPVDDYAGDVTAHDFEPREFVWVTWMPDYQTFDPDPTIEEPDYIDQRWINLQRIYEEFGWSVRYEVISYEEIFPMFVTSIMAGAPLGDIIDLPGANTLMAADMGLIQPLESFIPPTAQIWSDDWWVHPSALHQGNHHTIANRSINTEDMVFGFRRDLIEAAGLEDPSVLWERGDWTWDTFLEYLQATTVIGPDGDTVQYGLRGNPHRMLRLFITSNDGAIVTDDLNHGFGMRQTVRAFEFFQQIFQTEGLGHPYTDYWSELVGDGGVDTAFFVTEMWTLGWGARGDHIEHIGGVPFPVGPDNTSGNVSMSRLRHGPAIPRGVENPYEAYRMISEMRFFFRYYSEEAYESETGEATVEQFINATREGWVHTLFASVEDAERVLYGMSELSRFDVGANVYDFQNMMYEIGGQIMRNEGTSAQLLEAHRQEMDDVIATQFRE